MWWRGEYVQHLHGNSHTIATIYRLNNVNRNWDHGIRLRIAEMRRTDSFVPFVFLHFDLFFLFFVAFDNTFCSVLFRFCHCTQVVTETHMSRVPICYHCSLFLTLRRPGRLLKRKCCFACFWNFMSDFRFLMATGWFFVVCYWFSTTLFTFSLQSNYVSSVLLWWH